MHAIKFRFHFCHIDETRRTCLLDLHQSRIKSNIKNMDTDNNKDISKDKKIRYIPQHLPYPKTRPRCRAIRYANK
jgi:hypothetical protein